MGSRMKGKGSWPTRALHMSREPRYVGTIATTSQSEETSHIFDSLADHLGVWNAPNGYDVLH